MYKRQVPSSSTLGSNGAIEAERLQLVVSSLSAASGLSFCISKVADFSCELGTIEVPAVVLLLKAGFDEEDVYKRQPESNMNWQDIKDALDEQDFEAFWVVEREGFYDEHDKCIADDARWIKENIH